MSLERYVEAILGAKDAGLPVLLGLEVDFVPATIEAVLEVLEPYPFDLLIGSVHWIDGWWFDRRHSIHEWERRGHRRVYEQYFALETQLASSGVVDVLAHSDRVKYLGHRLPEEPADMYERLVTAGEAAWPWRCRLRAGHPAAEVPGPTLLGCAGRSIGHDQAGWDMTRWRALPASPASPHGLNRRGVSLVPIEWGTRPRGQWIPAWRSLTETHGTRGPRRFTATRRPPAPPGGIAGRGARTLADALAPRRKPPGLRFSRRQDGDDSPHLVRRRVPTDAAHLSRFVSRTK
jgi:hypothetical protein